MFLDPFFYLFIISEAIDFVKIERIITFSIIYTSFFKHFKNNNCNNEK